MLGGFIHLEEEETQQQFLTSDVHLNHLWSILKMHSEDFPLVIPIQLTWVINDASLVEIHYNIMSKLFLIDPRVWVINSLF